MVYIGIDLGTTYSRVAMVENGKPKIIFNEEGVNFTPSIVSYGDNNDNNEVLVGNHALNYPDLSRVLYDSKRLIGWRFLYNFPIAENRQLWTFNLDTRNNKVGYVINPDNDALNEVFITPEEVSAEILKKIKQIAESYIGDEVIGAVVAIPAFFQTAQIEATKRAVQMAGLELKMLVREPTAAAIAYNEDRKLEDSKIMIFDFGGGTLDINICEIKNGGITIKVVKGDQHLGGQDFDGIIMNYVLQEYMRTSTYDIIGNKRLLKTLRTQCRAAKEALSFDVPSYNIHLDIDLNAHLDLDVQLKKIKLNELCEELYSKTTKLIDDALKMAKLRTDDIDHVILVGGSTRIPAIRDILKMKFGNEKLKLNTNPDEAVVFGAAILADAIEKKKEIPLINNTMSELSWDNNDLQFGGGNSFNNSHEILFYFYYRNNDDKDEGKICLLNSSTCSVEEIAKFDSLYLPDQVEITQDKIFGIDLFKKIFEIFDLDTRQISRGPDPPEWRSAASAAYFKNKLYYLGGWDIKIFQETNRVDVFIDGQWQTGPAFPFPISRAQTITCDEILYVIDGFESRKIYLLSDNEREWEKAGEIPEQRLLFGVTSLNGKIYITGGLNDFGTLKSCLCFDPSAPVDSRISRIADMNYARCRHSLVVANGKLYAIGGFQNIVSQSVNLKDFCDVVEEYDPRTNKWREVGKINIK